MPLLYKLLAILLQQRLTPTLNEQLSKEQAGFRKGFSTIDHLHTLTQIQEKAAEWQIPLWTCFIDYEKAFDSIEHFAIWTALTKQGVSQAYIELLQRLYANQCGQVSVDGTISRQFNLSRGTKQGDPLSSLLFNAVLEDVFREIRPKWIQKRAGLEMSLDVKAHLSHLCFADDVVLMAANANQLKMMMQDLKEAAAKRGLKIHCGKTKVLTNASRTTGATIPSSIAVAGEEYEILCYEGSTKYLGRKICYDDQHEVEFGNRVAKAWAAFSKFKRELTDRRHRLEARLKLFDAVVTSTLMYGCETWSLRIDQQRRLSVLQRKMLRMVLNARRRVICTGSSDASASADISDQDSDTSNLEPWVDFLRRTAQWTDEQLQKAGLSQWIVAWKKKKWQWAAKLMKDDADKWSVRATLWQPLLHSSAPRGRKQARPKKRWEQDFVDYLKNAWPENDRNWHELARDEEWWMSQTEAFASFCA